MMMRPTEHRIVDIATLSAKRLAKSFWGKPKGSNPAAKMGLRYERRVKAQLDYHVAKGNLYKVEHNPWFQYDDKFGSGHCCPDFLVWTLDDRIIIVEVKLTWVEVAITKLGDLYGPVVMHALQLPAAPLVIVRNVTPMAPLAKQTMREALADPHRLLHWPDTGRLLW